jgi:ubiquinol-cytochrome c reductase cytochrome b subunit
MMGRFIDWLDNRTGVRDFVHEALYERIPGGARWRYVWGSTLVFAFFVQMVTGAFLWMAYSPSSQTAWESVYYIQHEMQGGWLLRGVHHFMAQAMVVLLALHLMQVVIDGAYRAPREINFWLGLILMLLVLGLSLTGYLLPWDQKGYWATRVATNLMSLAPGIGESFQRLVVGGGDYGHHTLTRFFALHAGILPGLLILFLVLHVALFRRHGICYKQPVSRADSTFWPDQVLRDAVACLAVLAVVVGLVVLPALTGRASFAEPEQLGAELGPPANPGDQYAAPRPEWYFLFLFQFLKLFEGYGHNGEVLGAIVVPAAVLLLLFLMPIVGRWRLGHRFNIAFTFVLLLGIGWLTFASLRDDYVARRVDPGEFSEVAHQIHLFGDDEAKMRAHFGEDQAKIEEFLELKRRYADYQKSSDYLAAVAQASREAQRVKELAAEKQIPPTGALALLRDDARTQGERLFTKHCASCHDYIDPDGQDSTRIAQQRLQRAAVKDGDDPNTKPEVVRDAQGKVKYEPSGAPNLYNFASRKWLAGFLDPDQINRIETKDLMLPADAKDNDPTKYVRAVTAAPYFGNTAHRFGGMVEFVKDPDQWGLLEKEEKEKVIAALSAQAQLPYQREDDRKSQEADAIKEGETLIVDNCTTCHHFNADDQGGEAPDLAKYGSRQWLIDFISNPEHARFYGPRTEERGNDRMPAFAKDKQNPAKNILTQQQIEHLADFLRRDYFEPAVQEE